MVEAVFKYSQMIRDKGPQQYIFDESKALGRASFEFYEKSDPMSTCIEYAQYLQLMDETNIDRMIESQYVVKEFDTKRLQEIADVLASKDKLNILIGSKKFEG